MKKPFAILGLLALSVVTSACALRDAQMFTDDTAELFATRNPQIKSCYDQALVSDSAAAGTVAVSFQVEKKTGNIINPQIVPERTTAPEPVGMCVVNALQGLVLEPPDKNDGQGVFTWEFVVNPPVQAAAPAEPAPAG